MFTVCADPCADAAALMIMTSLSLSSGSGHYDSEHKGGERVTTRWRMLSSICNKHQIRPAQV